MAISGRQQPLAKTPTTKRSGCPPCSKSGAPLHGSFPPRLAAVAPAPLLRQVAPSPQALFSNQAVPRQAGGPKSNTTKTSSWGPADWGDWQAALQGQLSPVARCSVSARAAVASEESVSQLSVRALPSPLPHVLSPGSPEASPRAQAVWMRHWRLAGTPAEWGAWSSWSNTCSGTMAGPGAVESSRRAPPTLAATRPVPRSQGIVVCAASRWQGLGRPTWPAATGRCGTGPGPGRAFPDTSETSRLDLHVVFIVTHAHCVGQHGAVRSGSTVLGHQHQVLLGDELAGSCPQSRLQPEELSSVEGAAHLPIATPVPVWERTTTTRLLCAAPSGPSEMEYASRVSDPVD